MELTLNASMMRKNVAGSYGFAVITRQQFDSTLFNINVMADIQKMVTKLNKISLSLKWLEIPTRFNRAVWLMHTPFDAPVVPDEHAMIAVCLELSDNAVGLHTSF